jgi:hypothetical protein
MERVTEPVKILLSAMSDEPTMMLHTGINIAALRRALLTFIFIAISAALLASCATVGPTPGVTPPSAPAPPSAPTVPRNAEPPPPKVNLSGFPLPYRQGYADGCASAGGTEHKDAARFSADMNYRTGWTDGRGLCTKK